MEQKKHPNEICAAWKKHTGNLLSGALTVEQLNQLKLLQEGDRILIKLIEPDRKFKESSPDAYLEIFKRKD